MSVLCSLSFPRGDYYGGPDYREEESILLDVAPRADESILLNVDGDDEWWIDRVVHVPHEGVKVWLFLRHDRYSR